MCKVDSSLQPSWVSRKITQWGKDLWTIWNLAGHFASIAHALIFLYLIYLLILDRERTKDMLRENVGAVWLFAKFNPTKRLALPEHLPLVWFATTNLAIPFFFSVTSLTNLASNPSNHLCQKIICNSQILPMVAIVKMLAILTMEENQVGPLRLRSFVGFPTPLCTRFLNCLTVCFFKKKL